MRWTTSKIRYLEEHAGDGAKAIADALHCSVRAVEVQASRYGISLRRVWQCPNCGMRVRKPLSSRTGWCSACTKSKRRERIAEEVREIEEEVRRNEMEDKARQRLYSRKDRAKKKLKRQKK